MKIIIPEKVYVTNRMRRTNCKTQLIIAIFADSDCPEALIELDEGEYKNLESARNSLNQAIRSMRKTSLYRAQIRDEGEGDRIYIIRKV